MYYSEAGLPDAKEAAAAFVEQPNEDEDLHFGAKFGCIKMNVENGLPTIKDKNTSQSPASIENPDTCLRIQQYHA